MIIYMCDFICITNRNLCHEDLLQRVKKVIKLHPNSIILREKDLLEGDYKKLAESFLTCCKEEKVTGILHTYYQTAKLLECRSIHIPLPILRKMSVEERAYFSILGTSCHTVEEAKEAEKLGCTYLIAGHIYETDCKRGVPPRGLTFLREVTHSVSCDVWAIGGITFDRMEEVKRAGAKGGCMMSSLMTDNI